MSTGEVFTEGISNLMTSLSASPVMLTQRAQNTFIQMKGNNKSSQVLLKQITKQEIEEKRCNEKRKNKRISNKNKKERIQKADGKRPEQKENRQEKEKEKLTTKKTEVREVNLFLAIIINC